MDKIRDIMFGDIIDKTRANVEAAHKQELARREKALLDKAAANQKAFEEERQRKLKEFMDQQDALDKLMKSKPQGRFKPFGK